MDTILEYTPDKYIYVTGHNIFIDRSSERYKQLVKTTHYCYKNDTIEAIVPLTYEPKSIALADNVWHKLYIMVDLLKIVLSFCDSPTLYTLCLCSKKLHLLVPRGIFATREYTRLAAQEGMYCVEEISAMYGYENVVLNRRDVLYILDNPLDPAYIPKYIRDPVYKKLASQFNRHTPKLVRATIAKHYLRCDSNNIWELSYSTRTLPALAELDKEFLYTHLYWAIRGVADDTLKLLQKLLELLHPYYKDKPTGAKVVVDYAKKSACSVYLKDTTGAYIKLSYLTLAMLHKVVDGETTRLLVE